MALRKEENTQSVGGASRYLFLLPATVIYISVILVPALYTFYLSFFRWNGVSSFKKFVGFMNYFILFKDSTFLAALQNNVVLLILELVLTGSIALFFAIFINRTFKGRKLVRGVLYFPYTLSSIVTALAWVWVYQPQLGLLKNLMQIFHLAQFNQAWLSNASTALFAVFVAEFWHNIGAPMILFLSGLQTIPNELIEAACIDGATKFHVFRHITIPMLRESFVIVFATLFIHALKVYDLVYAMTGGGPSDSTQTLATVMVTQTFKNINFGMGSATACVMVVLLMIVIIPYVSYMARE